MLRLTPSALLGLFASVAATGSMSERELEVRARELDLRERELDLRERELAAEAPAPATKPLKTFGTGLAGADACAPPVCACCCRLRHDRPIPLASFGVRKSDLHVPHD